MADSPTPQGTPDRELIPQEPALVQLRQPSVTTSHNDGELKIVTHADSDDGSAKYVLECSDGNRVEAVYIEILGHHTFCVSSQVGCALRCGFCATGLDGLKRNLTSEEIVNEVLTLVKSRNLADSTDPFQISFMGMGEPLLNYDAVLDASRQLTSQFGSRISFFLSTVGILPKMYCLAKDAPHFDLQVSLHGATDEQRSSLMPINRKYPLQEVIDAASHFAGISGRSFYVNYLVFKGVNDTDADAEQLVRLVAGKPALVKIARYNPVAEIDLAPVDDSTMDMFTSALKAAGIETFQFRSKATDVGGGCGHLRRKSERS